MIGLGGGTATLAGAEAVIDGTGPPAGAAEGADAPGPTMAAPAAGCPGAAADVGTTAEPADPRLALLRAGERSLAQGLAAEAVERFERAAQMRHEPDAELALLRARLQAGEYAQAMAFAAHVAGAHTDEPAAAALYAWLLDAGGQPEVARRLLVDARRIAPHDPLLRETERRLESNWPSAGCVLRRSVARFAPYGGPAPALPTSARIVSSGVLVDGGRRALVPWPLSWPVLRPLPGQTPRLWLRNGLGETVAARVERRDATLALLRLERPLAPAGTRLGAADPWAPRDPFAGSPAFLVEYAADDLPAAPGADAAARASDEAGAAADSDSPPAAPAWPRLWRGFAGSLSTSGERRLAMSLPPGPHGGPLFDAAGRLAGIVLTGADGVGVGGAGGATAPDARWRPASELRAWVDGGVGDSAVPAQTAETSTAAGIGLDRIYERGLRTALQVIAAP